MDSGHQNSFSSKEQKRAETKDATPLATGRWREDRSAQGGHFRRPHPCRRQRDHSRSRFRRYFSFHIHAAAEKACPKDAAFVVSLPGTCCKMHGDENLLTKQRQTWQAAPILGYLGNSLRKRAAKEITQAHRRLFTGSKSSTEYLPGATREMHSPTGRRPLYHPGGQSTISPAQMSVPRVCLTTYQELRWV